MEIMVAIAILGLLATVAIVNVHRAHQRAEEAAARLFVQQVAKLALTTYRLDQRSFPSTEEGLRSLVRPPGFGSAAAQSWRGPYIEGGEVPRDPWGEPYQYASPGVHNPDGYDIWSKGPDRRIGTADDIANWNTDAAREP